VDYKLDASGDIDLSSGDFEMVTGQDEIVQSLFTRVQLQLGEIAHAPDIGVPWFENVLVVSPSDDMLQFAFIPTIEDTPGVNRLLNIEFSELGSDRRLTVSAEVESIEGPIDFSLTVENI
jgi:hypothetical protein